MPLLEPDAAEEHRIDLWCDLLCPDCAAVLDEVDALRRRFPVRLRHFPLVSHLWAVPAAHVAQEAQAQGVLWSVVGAILGSYDEIGGVDDLVTLAARGGADPVAVRRALADGRHRSVVASDYAAGRRSGVRGVPTLVVHGVGEPVQVNGRQDRTGFVETATTLAETRGLLDQGRTD